MCYSKIPQSLAAIHCCQFLQKYRDIEFLLFMRVSKPRDKSLIMTELNKTENYVNVSPILFKKIGLSILYCSYGRSKSSAYWRRFGRIFSWLNSLTNNEPKVENCLKIDFIYSYSTLDNMKLPWR